MKNKDNDKKSFVSYLPRFISYYKPYKGLFAADMFFAIVIGATGLAFPWIMRTLINEVFTLSDKGRIVEILIPAGIFMLVLYVIEALAMKFVTSWGHILGARIERDMRHDLFTHMEKLSFSFFDDTSTGQMVSRIITDLQDITELAHHGPENLLISLIKIVGAFVILMNTHVGLTMVLLLFTVFMGLFTFFYRKKMFRSFMDNRVKIANVNAIVNDSLSGIRTVQSYSQEEVELEKFHVGNQEFYQSKKNMYTVMGTYHSTNGFLQGLLYVVTIVAGGFFVVRGSIKPGDLYLFVLYINMFLQPVRTLIQFNEQLQQGMTGFFRMCQILDTDPEIRDLPAAIDAGLLRGDIKFENVTFKYKDADEPVLENFSLDIKAKHAVALVGPSGVGKSTICSLIPRFYDVDKGAITIDGIDIRNMTLRSLRDNIAMVQQDVYLFNSSVRDNIAYGQYDATDEQIIAAAKQANIHDFIMTLSKGYDTMVGERGVRFSGGEKQRISIARAFLRNPPILILDEATSSLDNVSERAVQESLDRLSQDRTTIVIAHRLSTVRNADEILVLAETGITERGTHEELMARKGEYAGYYQIQFDGLSTKESA
ncbi:MAG: ABC transporter ATP-binding protein [Clostridiaceae bacterium]|jgi:ATP-binding cassette subfamily B protein|nr:ABC transporter ATP-binding protein [Clostridiaceae bacterium]